ncbi:MAG TPA: dockerin type 1, partial [Ruminococcus sp.]|nr:dockerin type 1 [Ruminococcus sp.]
TTTTTTTTTTTETTSDTTTTTETTAVIIPQIVKGDVNNDGIFNITDVILLQKYLLGESEIENYENADFYSDGTVNIFDLCCMKAELAKKGYA